MSDERRQDPRHEIPLVAYIQVIKSDVHEAGLTMSAKVEEISSSGLRISPAAELDQAEIEMFVSIPSGHRLFLAADVRWSATDGENWESGLEVIDRNGTDFRAWHMFANEINRVRVAEVS